MFDHLLHLFFFRPRKKRSENLSLQAQQFRFGDGYIACASNPQLVLGVQEGETGSSGSAAEVVLVKRRPDDILQRWILQENGYVL